MKKYFFSREVNSPCNKSGFTLIELLVVISIIGVLSTIVLGALGDARSQARDAKRLADIRTIQTALEIYNIDNGRYPIATGATSPNAAWANSNNTSWETLEELLGTTLPRDPLNSSGTASASSASSGVHNYSYFANLSSTYCNGREYRLVVNFENKDFTNDGFVSCSGGTVNYGNALVVGVGADGDLQTP